jgi:hypothetical protein
LPSHALCLRDSVWGYGDVGTALAHACLKTKAFISSELNLNRFKSRYASAARIITKSPLIQARRTQPVKDIFNRRRITNEKKYQACLQGYTHISKTHKQPPLESPSVWEAL